MMAFPAGITAREAYEEAELREYDSQEAAAFRLGAEGISNRGRGRLAIRLAHAAGKLWAEAEAIRRAKARP